MMNTASGTPVPQGNDPFAPTTQLKTAFDAEATWNNLLRVADATARNALAAPQVRDGILVKQLDDRTEWERRSGGWVLSRGFKSYTPDLLSGMNLGTGGTRTAVVQVDGRHVRAEHRYLFGSSTVALGTTIAPPFGTLPAASRQYGTAGQMTIFDYSGGIRYTSVVEVDAGDVLAPRGSSAAGTYVLSASFGGVVVPGVGDVLVLELDYISSADITSF